MVSTSVLKNTEQFLRNSWESALARESDPALKAALQYLEAAVAQNPEDGVRLAAWAERQNGTPASFTDALPALVQRALAFLCSRASVGFQMEDLTRQLPENTFNQAWPSRVPAMRRVISENFSEPINALEVGAWFGIGSTRLWLDMLPEGSTLTIVDVWKSFISKVDLDANILICQLMNDLAPAALASTLRTVVEYEKRRPDLHINLVRGESAIVLKMLQPGQFDFVYVDGSHYYQDVKRDLFLSKKLLNPKHSIICGDDLELVPDAELVEVARNHISKDWLVLPDGRGFHPGVMLGLIEEIPKCKMENGFWWSTFRDGSFS